MTLTITPLYAAALGLMMIGLTIMVIVHRARSGVSILHGEDMHLAESIRRHGNFIENVPMALILLGFAELMGAPPLLLHSAGAILILSRVLHPFGIYHDHDGPVIFRILGGVGTWLAMLAAIGYIGWVAL